MTQTRTIIAGGALAALLVAFLCGRWSARAATVATKDTRKVETTTQATATATTAARVEAIAHKTAAGDVETKTVTVVKWLPAVTAKNGCPELPAHTEQVTTTETHAVTARTADTQRHANTAITKEAQSTTKVVELHTIDRSPILPSWSVSLMPGAQLFGAKAVTLWGPAVLGASVEHRFIGPVSLGLWASTSGAAGITLRTEF